MMIYAGKHASELTINGKDKDSLKFAKDFQEKSQKLQETLRAANQEIQKSSRSFRQKILPISLSFPINSGWYRQHRYHLSKP